MEDSDARRKTTLELIATTVQVLSVVAGVVVSVLSFNVRGRRKRERTRQEAEKPCRAAPGRLPRDGQDRGDHRQPGGQDAGRSRQASDDSELYVAGCR
jgi:hypothetical protein